MVARLFVVARIICRSTESGQARGPAPTVHPALGQPPVVARLFVVARIVARIICRCPVRVHGNLGTSSRDFGHKRNQIV